MSKKLTNMVESRLTDKFRKLFKLRHPDGFIYKIPDTMMLGGKKPFDMLIILEGHIFCFEFKRGSVTEPTPYQKYHLDRAAYNGAKSRIVNEENLNDVLEEIMDYYHGRKK